MRAIAAPAPKTATPSAQPEQVGRMALAGAQLRMWPERSPNSLGSKTRSVNSQRPSTRANRSRYSPAEDRVQAEARDLEHREVGPGGGATVAVDAAR